MTPTGYENRIGAIFVDECEILVKREERCQGMLCVEKVAMFRI